MEISLQDGLSVAALQRPRETRQGHPDAPLRRHSVLAGGQGLDLPLPPEAGAASTGTMSIFITFQCSVNICQISCPTMLLESPPVKSYKYISALSFQ